MLPLSKLESIIFPVEFFGGRSYLMTKRFLALLFLSALLITACTVDAGEGLMEMEFDGEQPLSETITVEVGEDLSQIEFFVDAQFSQGSVTIYVYDPGDQVHILALGATDSTLTLNFFEPSSGKWMLKIHVDGNSGILVKGKIRLWMKTEG